MGWYYRAPKTTQERRLVGRRDLLHIDEYVVRIRPSRNWTNLPNTYDDISRSDIGDRSWKRHRLTQYRTDHADFA